MNTTKRNPLMKGENKELNTVVGDLGQEIQEQDLENVDGGSTPLCVISWVNDKITEKYKCGGVFTATAECFDC